MPHLSVDPVVLTAAVVTRLQTLVAREIAPGDFGVLTVGSLHAGISANVIADRATMQLNFRAYDEAVLDQLVDGAERIIRAKCKAARSPKAPEIELFSHLPLTDNDPDVTARVREALIAQLGQDRVEAMPPSTGSEDFSVVPDAFGAPPATGSSAASSRGGRPSRATPRSSSPTSSPPSPPAPRPRSPRSSRSSGRAEPAGLLAAGGWVSAEDPGGTGTLRRGGRERIPRSSPRLHRATGPAAASVPRRSPAAPSPPRGPHPVPGIYAGTCTGAMGRTPWGLLPMAITPLFWTHDSSALPIPCRPALPHTDLPAVLPRTEAQRAKP